MVPLDRDEPERLVEPPRGRVLLLDLQERVTCASTGRNLERDGGQRAREPLAASTRAAALNVGTDLRLSGEDGSGRSDLVDAFDELEATTRDLEAIVARVRERIAPSRA